jgi:hypothetical protein
MAFVPKRHARACVADEVKCLAIYLKFLVREHGSPFKLQTAPSVFRQARFPITVAMKTANKATELKGWSAPQNVAVAGSSSQAFVDTLIVS